MSMENRMSESQSSHTRCIWPGILSAAVATTVVGLCIFSSRSHLANVSGVSVVQSTRQEDPSSVADVETFGNLTPQHLSVRGKRLRLPGGLRATDQYNYSSFYFIQNIKDTKQAELWYTEYSTLQPLECSTRSRLGHSQDGGWDTCLVPPYIPSSSCLIYSFGINRDWSFDETVSKQYGCRVKAFDPSLHLDIHKHSDLIWFYPYGLDGSNYVNNKNWTMKTLQTFLEQFGDRKTVIDYLKVDIEGSEWPAFRAAVTDGVFSWVKQLSFESHTIFASHTSMKTWLGYLTVLHDLDKLGFKKWYIHHNEHTVYESEFGNGFLTYGKEFGYININFLDPQYEIDLKSGTVGS